MTRAPVNSRDPTGTRRVENREVRRVRTIVRAYRDALVDVLRNTENAPDVVREGFRGRRPGDGEGILDRYMRAMRDDLDAGIDDHIRDTEVAAVKNADRAMKAMGAGILLGDIIIPREETELLRANLRDNYARVVDKMAADVNRAVLEGYQKGLGARETAKLAEEVTEGLEYDAERIVRTETMRVGDITAKARYDQIGDCDGYFSYPTADDRTCPVCRGWALNGTPYPTERTSGELHLFGKDAPMALPWHPNCRCTRLPHFEGEPPMQI